MLMYILYSIYIGSSRLQGSQSDIEYGGLAVNQLFSIRIKNDLTAYNVDLYKLVAVFIYNGPTFNSFSTADY